MSYEFADVRRAWLATNGSDSAEEVATRARFFSAMVRAIAEASPVSPERLAGAAEVSTKRAAELIRSLSASGVQLDDDGNLVGAALTPVPTPHRFRVNGRDLYAWCALDALFLPGLLGATADVESTCPATGAEIRLTVSPPARADYAPAGTVLTVVVPGASVPLGSTGPDSPT
ncbi:MAG: hypothetical protein JRG76_19995 [Deltaproteobacteria bacterium]|nr:hypothetical protein [Deltaproteobacteria bacterium]